MAMATPNPSLTPTRYGSQRRRRMSTNLSELPKDLPRPVDDGAASHLQGMQLPAVALPSTNGATVDLGGIPGRFVLLLS